MNEIEFITGKPVHDVSENKTGNSLENEYLRLRQKERRIYSDELVLNLPHLPDDHIHYKEWQLRKESYLRLKKYLKKKIKANKILEVGCGNGWLSHRLSAVAGSEVTGLDINQAELQQAQRVFKHVHNLRFIHGSIHSNEIENNYFDIIVFAASIQYFSSLKEIINQAMGKLNPTGEIHIIDSNWHEQGKINAAKKRTEGYFRELGFPEMTNHYFHHSTKELRSFRFKTLYQPSIFNRLLNNKNPFPWICIRKQ